MANMVAVRRNFNRYSHEYWINMLDKLMEDNPPSKSKGKSDWYKRLEKTKQLIEDGQIDDSVMLSVAMARVGL